MEDNYVGIDRDHPLYNGGTDPHSMQGAIPNVHPDLNVGGPKGPTGSVLAPTPAPVERSNYPGGENVLIQQRQRANMARSGATEEDMGKFAQAQKSTPMGHSIPVASLPGGQTKSIGGGISDMAVASHEEANIDRPTGGTPLAGPATAAFKKGAAKYAASYGKGASGGTGKEEDY